MRLELRPQEIPPHLLRYFKPVKRQAKALALVPQRIAIACQEDGWIVRNYVIIKTWMPESAKDRMTRNYRVLLMLVKQPRYWYDAAAVRVASKGIEYAGGGKDGQYAGNALADYGAGLAQDPSETKRRVLETMREGDGLRNLGDIWEIPPAAYPDAHFATFAIEEPETCIKASCPAEICVKCGKARVRIVKKANIREHPQRQGRKDRNKADYDGEGYAERDSGLGLTWDEQTVGWSDCGCNEGWVSGTVLDCFIGTGTTAIAARKLGRRCIGIDASEDYLKQAVTRLQVGDSGIRRMVQARRAGAEQGRFDA